MDATHAFVLQTNINNVTVGESVSASATAVADCRI